MSCSIEISKPRPTKKHVSFRKIKSIDIKAFRNELLNTDLIIDSPNDLDELVHLYNSTLESM